MCDRIFQHKRFQTFNIFFIFLFTFSTESCIVNCEQSRRPRVKCHRDGELPGGRRNRSTMRSPHPLLHMGHPPLCSNDTRSGEWSAVNVLPFPTGDP